MNVSRIISVCIVIASIAPVPVMGAECIVLLHGLARTSNSMNKLERILGNDGYDVINVDYASRSATIEALSDEAVSRGIRYCQENAASPVSFVTHSLGGILVRQYFGLRQLEDLGRVVMLGPPNRGTEIAEGFIPSLPGYDLWNGPAGKQLGTSEHSLPRRLGPVSFELGVIAGTTSFNPFLSAMLPDEDDGKVTVKNTRIEGMCGFVTLPVTHTFMMTNDDVIEQVKSFLQQGRFEGDTAEQLPKCHRSKFKS